ncbi:hypothetical protein Val02_90180 [Virgisporangium aliadipatigenens]|uniref:Uncharacterized protein n=1 Tax=Virgisporangium aliadipatigenens TaxID=741659 RepID=A0A8J3YX42_9ACTN|nr:hypothetical protein [Virgisporangium aliadipatigenens]GIJ52132.1 hypothetical protein Val02_90180 [Virgisporangium aliadipatigenens]
MISELLRTRDFWRLYTLDEDADDFDLMAAEERFEADHGGFRLDFATVGGTRLRLDVQAGMFTLYLAAGQEHELGHWDQARWAPWCLRWEEVRAYAALPQPGGLTPDLTLLLLASFVGHGSDEGELLAARRKEIAAAVERVGVFAGAEATRLAERLLMPVPEDDYAWTHDPALGWTLTGDYPCYGNRAKDHGHWPFEEYNRFRSDLGLS